MLKALELIGFKSFADKTRFEFPSGITVVVGPNGSGKSNVVDAIKWVLGEQSVKSLRGKEMADVIFNGSSSRKPVNTAETTLTFDNSAGLLAIDTPEVHITRRVYRSGEGEYLINRQACRLRDIRDLFAGTGAATEAYSVIEQGKVDVLLQSSPRDRRVIFEEAAGISRFKTKKLEATRRLDRVDQNLLRLSDIVEEVESRLRSVRMQATKARRYKQYSDRLQELRTQIGLADWRALSDKLKQLERELAEHADQIGEHNARLEADEARSLGLENHAADLDETIRRTERRIAGNREKIAACESTVGHERTRSNDLEEEIARYRSHLSNMQTKAGDLKQQIEEISASLSKAEGQHASFEQQLGNDSKALADITGQLAQLRRKSEEVRTRHLGQVRHKTTLSSQITGLESQATTAQKTREDRTERIEALTVDREQLSERLEVSRQEQTRLAKEAERCEKQWRNSQSGLSASRRRLTGLQTEFAQLEARHAGALERASVLAELEKRLEGLSAGAKEVLQKVRESPEGPFSQVRGLVADLLHVKVDTAPLIEIALGDLAHHLVVGPGEGLIEHLEGNQTKFAGRVEFLRLEVAIPASPIDRIQLGEEPGVLGRADEFVETAPEFVPLLRRLLGRVWLVETLSVAVRLANGPGRGLDYVTLSGERLAADGTIAVGPRHSATGLISRRSELRALQGTIEELASKISSSRREIDELSARITQQDRELAERVEARQIASDALLEQRHHTEAAGERLEVLGGQIELAEMERKEAEDQLRTASELLSSARRRLQETDRSIAQFESELVHIGEQIDELEGRRSGLSENATSQQVRLAKSEQRLDSLRYQKEQFTHDQREGSRALGDSQRQLEQSLERAEQSRRTLLRVSAEIAEHYLQKETYVAEVTELMHQREIARQDRAIIVLDAQQIRAKLRSVEEELRSVELAAGEVRHERTRLAERLREDYEIELAELEHAPTDEELEEREAAQEEITDLRRKINNIGNVNLDALDELDELESRFGSLSAQYEDLSKAKASLEQIIGKINADSRRLFAETLETVRGHFQTLFRKLFGGGQADIILDEAEDILESGIEIVARPPGKEPRSISLLSGGEKTMTCVALLMAIFKSRPSPFCVLDEVDAALDEVNIERFVNVVNEFLDTTQFIIITHSKKTMTCAHSLYGITMQESGISKRVSVRFEDVSEDGHIHQSAIDRHDAEEAA